MIEGILILQRISYENTKYPGSYYHELQGILITQNKPYILKKETTYMFGTYITYNYKLPAKENLKIHPYPPIYMLPAKVKILTNTIAQLEEHCTRLFNEHKIDTSYCLTYTFPNKITNTPRKLIPAFSRLENLITIDEILTPETSKTESII